MDTEETPLFSEVLYRLALRGGPREEPADPAEPDTNPDHDE